jgi:predicted HTH domain antitoxin
MAIIVPAPWPTRKPLVKSCKKPAASTSRQPDETGVEVELSAPYGSTMSTLTLQLPEDLVAKLASSPEAAAARIKTELALSLYSQSVLSPFEACQLTGMSRFEFEDLLGRREIIRPYTVEMLNEDMRHADGRR